VSHTFVVPPLNGPGTGGTLYNRGLIGALRALGTRCEVCTLDEATASDILERSRFVWIDSLYIAAVPPLRKRLLEHAVEPPTLGLILHALPSFLESPQAPQLGTQRIGSIEHAALRSVDTCLVTSSSFAKIVTPLAPTLRIVVIEPAVEWHATPAGGLRNAPGHARPRGRYALLVNHVVPNKHVLELLDAIGPRLKDSDDFGFVIAGRLDLAPDYARACIARVCSNERTESRVRFLGGVAHEQLPSLIVGSDAFVSPSPFETYGMALAEARALGVPILARRGGHVAQHVDSRAGGELVDDVGSLASTALTWMRDAALLAQKRRLAQDHRRPRSPRTWSDVAQEFLARTALPARAAGRSGV
jgi:glycosyltransferase involved in cell wall biosynthesis